MLNDIRENKTSLTTYILVGMAGIGMLFIGVPFFSADQGISVAEVNGQDISYRQLQQVAGNILQNNPNLTPQQADSEGMRQLISQTVLSEHAAHSGFVFPDHALYEVLKQRFHDEQAYQHYLNRIGMDAADYERLLRQEMATENYYDILARAQIFQPAIMDTFIDNITQSRTFSMIRLPLSSAVDATEISENDLQTYYDAHHDALMQPPEVAIDYILYSISDLAKPDGVSAQALADARAEWMQKHSKRDGEYLLFDQQAAAEKARQELLDGTPYSSIASTIDDGTLSGEHGKLDLHSKGAGISQNIDDALFALKASGDISPVIETSYGYMIVIAGKIEASAAPSDAELRQKIADDTAQVRYHELTNKAFDASQSGADMAQLAAMLNSPIKQTALFTAATPPEPWIGDKDIQVQLFGDAALPAGDMAQPVALSDNQSVFFKVAQREAAQLPPLTAIRDQVAALATRAKAEVALEQTAQEIAEQWRKAPPSAALLDQYGATLREYPHIHPGQNIDGFSAQDVDALFTQKDRFNVITAANGDKLITRLDSVSSGEDNPAIAAQWQHQIQLQAHLMGYQGILKWLTEQADIRINRDAMP